MMNREQKILKAVLLLRKFNIHQTKEEQIEEVKMYFTKDDMTDESLQEWINDLKGELSKSPEQISAEAEERIERLCETEAEQVRQEIQNSMCEKSYGPSNPWDAPGMSVSDFI